MERPRRSGRATYAPSLAFPSPTVSQQHPTPPPATQRMPSSASSLTSMPSGSRLAVPMGNQSGGGMAGNPRASMFAPSMHMQPPMPGGGVGGPSGPMNASALNNFPLARTSAPIPPQVPIGPGQARFTTFASRAKMGVSTLMQPISTGQEFGGDLFQATTERTRATGSRRRAAAGVRYYGEDLSDMDDDDDERGTSPSKANTPMEHEEEEIRPGALLGQPPPGNKIFSKRAHRVHPITPNEVDLHEQAGRREFLIPIKIEFETDTHRVRDSFTWNMHERIVKPRDFARIYVRDLDLPSEPYVAMIESAIVDQIKLIEDSGLDLVEIGPAAGGPFASKDGRKRIRDARTWDWGIKRRKGAQNEASAAAAAAAANADSTKEVVAQQLANGVANESTTAVDDRWNTEGSHGNFEDDLRVIVDYDVQVYRHHLRDRMEWDLCSPLTPEAFAAQMCKDLCLSGEAMPIIANAVREQLINHMRTVIELDLVGKGTEYARWQQEIDDAEREMSENYRRSLQGLPALPPKPLQVMPEEAEEGDGAAGEVVGDRPRRRRAGMGVDEESSAAATPQPGGGGNSTTNVAQASASKNVILRTPEQRKGLAEFFQLQLTERGPRRLEGVWREYHDSREFGPLLEMLTDEDLERMEADAIRASRRGRRDLQRTVGRRSRR